MSLPSFFTYLPLFWLCVTAVPAGPGWWPNGTHPIDDDFHTAAYGLIETYDGTNWLNKFDVQDVGDLSKASFLY
jgi:hypothetical protein